MPVEQEVRRPLSRRHDDRGGDCEELSIALRCETRAKLEQRARAAARPITAAELAAAVVEQFVATAGNG